MNITIYFQLDYQKLTIKRSFYFKFKNLGRLDWLINLQKVNILN